MKFNTDGKLRTSELYRCVDPIYGLRLNRDYAALWTGERRSPTAGEWYLSGAVIEAYQAPNDLTTVHAIARIVRVEQQQHTDYGVSRVDRAMKYRIEFDDAPRSEIAAALRVLANTLELRTDVLTRVTVVRDGAGEPIGMAYPVARQSRGVG